MTGKQNGFLSGTNGKVWLNNVEMNAVASYEATVTGAFDDVDCIGEYATFQQYHGYKISGTLTLHKLTSAEMARIAQAYRSGIMPDLRIMSKQYDPKSGRSERVVVSDIVFTEFALARMEAKTLTDESFPFSGARYEILEEL